MGDKDLTTILTAIGFAAALGALFAWKKIQDRSKATQAAAVPAFRLPMIAKAHRKYLGAVAAIALMFGAWWYYGRSVTFVSSDHPKWIEGTLSMLGNNQAIARLHNNRDGWVVQHVVLVVWSGKAKPCKKNSPGCSADEGLNELSFGDAEEKGRYRCVSKEAGVPDETFECSFTYPYSVGWGRRFGWTILEIVARRENPLGI